jgi:hypothetical protein
LILLFEIKGTNVVVSIVALSIAPSGDDIRPEACLQENNPPKMRVSVTVIFKMPRAGEKSAALWCRC